MVIGFDLPVLVITLISLMGVKVPVEEEKYGDILKN